CHERAISYLVPRRVGLSRNGRVVIVRTDWGGWPAMLPQHGKGRKHMRRIALEPWQEKLVVSHPDHFVRGCIHSDGCRHRRIVRGKNYPAYGFQPVERHSQPLRLDVSAARDSAYAIEPDRDLDRSTT